jgi:hypothetical protein
VRVVFGAGPPGSTSKPETGDGGAESPPATQLTARGRSWELEPNVVANLAARAVGLNSPAAPPEGDLVPRATGWLIGTGPPRQQLYPVFSRRSQVVLGLMCLAVTVVQYAGLLESWLVGGLVFGAPLMGALTCLEIVPRARLRWQLEKARRVASLADAPRGTLVRVTGTIAQQATVPTLFRGVPAVLFRNRVSSGDQTRGQDFLVDLDQGEQAKVAARRAFLLDPPTRTREPPACGPVSEDQVDGRVVLQPDLRFRRSLRSGKRRYESSVGPGDRVEVCGIVEHVLDPALENPSPREPPLRAVLMADGKTPLLVRRA